MSAALAPVDPAQPLRAPSLTRRMACWLYEGVILFGVIMVPSLVFGIVADTRHALNHRHGLQTLVFCVLALYFVYFWRRGQTLPMRTWRIRIVDRNGKPLTWPRALLRYLLAWVWFLPPLVAMAPFRLPPGQTAVLMIGWIAVWALLSRFPHSRQFVHDLWAGTRLIDADPAAPDSRPPDARESSPAR